MIDEWINTFSSLQILCFLLLHCHQTQGLRCYTDLDATKSMSVECGMNTGCVKIYKKADEYDPDTGKFIPQHKRGPEKQLFRGCFLVATPDICFDSKSGLSYCWCSHRDLCNSSTRYSLNIFLGFLLPFHALRRSQHL